MKHILYNKAFKAGFTIIELMVSLAIMIAILSIILFNYRSFDSNVVLTNLAYDIALSVRKAQAYGISVKGIQVGSDQYYGYRYGVEFKLAEPQSYSLYVDINDNGYYDADSGENLEIYGIKKPFKVLDICTVNGATEVCGLDRIDIFFKRPNPDAVVGSLKGSVSSLSSVMAKIKLGSSEASTVFKTITVSPVGQISVK